jgi:hypothetical protein
MGKPIGSALEMKQIVTPGTSPPANNLLLYVKADGKVYSKDSTGVEAQVGSVAALNASNLTSGTVPDARLPARLLAAPTAFTGDLNTLTSSGWYSTSNTATNTPYAGYFNVQVLANTGGDGITQIAYEVNAGLTVWMRQQQVGTWNPWRRIDPEFLRDAGNLTGALADARLSARLQTVPTVSASDLNTLVTAGWYATSAGVAGNAPSAGWFSVLVLLHPNGSFSITQVAYEVTTGQSIWVRTRDYTSAWQSWRRTDPEFLKDRANHTGTQAESTITNLVTDLAAKEPTLAVGSGTQYYRGDKTWQTLNAVAVANAMDLNTQQTITGLKLFQGRARSGFNAAVVQTPLTTSAFEAELTAQSMITLGESVAGDANPAVTFYRTAAGARTGTALRELWSSSNGPFKWQLGNSAAYGAETYTDLMTLTTAGVLSVATVNPTNALAQAKTHASPDTDAATTSLHHTIGTSATQAAAGNHGHKLGFDVGGSTSQVLNHNLNTRDVSVQVYRNTTPWDTVDCDVERTDLNNVTLRFTAAPAAAALRAVIV